MKRPLSQLLDSLMVRGSCVIHRRLRRRFPEFAACEPCGPDRLATIAAPERTELRDLPAWRGWRQTAFTFRSPVDSGIPECAHVAGILLRTNQEGPWVVIVRGRGQGSVPPRTFGFFQSLQGRALLEQGLNVLLFELPLHFSRRRRGMPADHFMQCYVDSIADFLNDYPWYPEVRAEISRGLNGHEELYIM